MQNIETKSLRHKLTIAEPSTVEEYDQLAKRSGACLDDARAYTRFHVTLGDVREDFVSLIEAETNIARRETPTGKFKEVDGKKVEIMKDESPDDYYQRVCAEKNVDPDSEPFAKLAARLSVGGDSEVKFDPSVSKREGKPKKLPDDYKNAATRIIDNGTWENNRKVLAKAVEKGGFYGKDIGEQPADKDAAINTLGWAIREYTLNKQRAEAAKTWQ